MRNPEQANAAMCQMRLKTTNTEWGRQVTPNGYHQACLRTWTNESASPETQRKLHAALGLASELGEIAGELCKATHYGGSYTKDEMIDELGDALWYLTMLIHEHGATLEEVMERNIAKLKERHPNGFSRDKYQPRDDVPGMASNADGKALHYDRN